MSYLASEPSRSPYQGENLPAKPCCVQKALALTGLCLLQASGVLLAEDAIRPALIPQPQKVECGSGTFDLNAKGTGGRLATAILVDAAAEETGRYLAAQLRQFAACDLPVRRGDVTGAKGNILLTTQESRASAIPEGYELTVSPDGVVIRAHDTAGLFYGVQSLLQLLPNQVAAASASAPGSPRLPAIHIEDQPRFKWRGMMLDVSRHFFSTSEVEQLLDAMSRYKLNTFHWHLADDQGWRIEIKNTRA